MGRLWRSFVLFASLSTAITSYIYLQILESRHSTFRSEAKTHFAKFIKNTTHDGEIDTNILRIEQLERRYVLPNITDYARSDLADLKKFAEGCSAADRKNSTALAKAWVWHAWKCDLTSELPKDFFQKPPLMHPAGVSFAKLRFDTFANASEAGAFLKDHARYFHVSEIRRLDTHAEKLPPELRPFVHLDTWAVATVGRFAESVLSDNHVVLRVNNNDRQGLYRTYARSEWDAHWLKLGVESQNLFKWEDCTLRYFDLCWVKPARVKYLQALAVTSGVMSVIWPLLMLWRQRRRNIRQAAKVQKERELMLATLSHELRTPATSIRLLSEVLRNEHDQLSPKGQGALLSVLDESRRLARMVDSSQAYLRTSNENNSQNEIVSDALPLIAKLAEEHGATLTPPSEEKLPRIFASTFQIEFCLKNALQNAQTHGQAPVTVSFDTTETHLNVVVTDGGTNAVTPRKDFVRFEKSQTSKGMGLGLHLVAEFMGARGGSAELQANPTRLILTWRRADA